MSKRSVEEGSGGSASGNTKMCQPPNKKVNFEPHHIGPVSTPEEMDIKVMQFQNKKLAQLIEQRMRTEAELRHHIEQLEKRQTQDEAVLNVVNRYWNQFNEDIGVLLQRIDAETADELENKNENEVTTSFMSQLSSWDKEELDDELANRVQVSKRALAKIVQVIDRIMQRNEKINLALQSGGTSARKDGEDENDGADGDNSSIIELLKQTHVQIMKENRNLQNLNTSLHEKFRTTSLKMKECEDTFTGKETEIAELKNQIDELQYDLEKQRCRNDKLENHLAEAIEKLKTYQQMYGDSSKTTSTAGKSSGHMNMNSQHLEELQKELEEYRELSNNRLQELNKLHALHRETLKEVEKLKMDIRQPPESVFIESAEYKCLQSQFSVLYNESMQIKTMLDATRNQLVTSKNQHLRNIELMEREELIAQKKMRLDMILTEDKLAQIRESYKKLQFNYETYKAANEQTAPINREMHQIIQALKNYNGQLKTEMERYKRRFKDASNENLKLRKDLEEVKAKLKSKKQKNAREVGKTENADGIKVDGCSGNSGNANANTDEEDVENLPSGASESIEKKESQGSTSSTSNAGCAGGAGGAGGAENTGSTQAATATGVAGTNSEEDSKEAQKAKIVETEVVRDLKAQLKKALDGQKEIKILLDMYKVVSKDQRDKVQLMATEKKLRSEIEELRQQVRKMQESKGEERKKLADERALWKIKELEDQKYELQKHVANQKPEENAWSSAGAPTYPRPFVGSHEEEALLNEMEVTGKAFEDMQEQNSRLIQQLREKNDASFKLMSEHIKSRQMIKLMREQNQGLEDLIITRDKQIESLHLVLRKLEEKECLLQSTVFRNDKELASRQQAMKLNKRNAIESAQSAADLKLHLEKYHSQMTQAQQLLAEKTTALEAEAYKNKRLEEELAQYKRKAERVEKIEMSGTTIDEAMQDEIREYKETLTCPSCQIKQKDAVITKCFHVFCYDCLRTRYDTRQRRCPKCNCGFGARDYHHLYLT